MANTQPSKLMFQPFASIINPGFWQQLTSVKLNKMKLSTDPIDIHGSYSCDLRDTLPCLASFDHSSFSDDQIESGTSSSCPLYGKLVCMNVMQEFIDFNKKDFLDSLGREILTSICDGRALIEPEEHLSRFALLVFADLKKYNYFYWFSFPAVNYPREVTITSSKLLNEVFNDKEASSLHEQYSKSSNEREFKRGYFIIVHLQDTNEIKCYPLNQHNECKSKYASSSIYFAFTDPSPNQAHPGWPLRNFLSLVAIQFEMEHVKVVRLRRALSSSSNQGLELHNSRVIELKLDLDDKYKVSANKSQILELPPITGWEKNECQQLAPKRVNLSSLLDPKRLAEDAVNLNLKLMKWRLLPGLDLDKIANTRCLLLGCGTLGCHIARGLLAWGIKHISIVDNSKISFSNPVRQTLYTFEDCSQSGKGIYKAHAAAESLRRIHPTIDVSAHVLSIPMPGHHVDEKEVEQTKKDVAELERLIESHDATFLLMDTRESRWLPTVIAMSRKKLVINAAIGFDTFLLQRFGIRDYNETCENEHLPAADADTFQEKPIEKSSHDHHCQQLASDKLGCYFCNDIVAPGDSTLDRTLDQQCTVSRPGVSMIVSALAVELLASIVSSAKGPLTPAPLDIHRIDPSMINDEDFGSELGIVPHSIRGNLNRYHIYMPTSPSFNKCSACSPAVVQAYQKLGYNFLHRVFDDPNYLEEVAGLKDLQNLSDDVWALGSDELILDDDSAAI